MAKTPSVALAAAPTALKCQTWVLKVSIHCQGCKRKVQKVLRGIDGVYATTVDSKQQKVTVTGNVEAETLIRKLKKTGKRAEIWPEILSTAEKGSTKTNNIEHGKGKNSRSEQNYTDDHRSKKKSVRFSGDSEPTGEDLQLPVKNSGSDSGNESKSGGKKKKKKKRNKGQKGDNGNGSSHSVSPTSSVAAGHGGASMDRIVGQENPIPAFQYSIPQPKGVSYVPSGYAPSTTYCIPTSPPYTTATRHQETTPPTFETLSIFSDENVNGCLIM